MSTPATALVRAGTPRGRWVLLATILGSSLAMLDGTVVNVALAAIARDLGGSFTALQWIVNGYTLTLASLILLGGVLGDRYGRRRVFLVGVVWFAVASALCAAAPDERVLVAARALQGVGGALLTPGSLAIISASFDPRDRARAVGVWSGLGGVAGALGPFLGGWLVALDWRWVFLVNLPLAALVVVVTLRHVPESLDEDGVPGRRLDVLGALLVVAALSGTTYGLTEAGRVGWAAVPVTVALLGVAAGALFVVVERRTRYPLVRLDIFADRVFTATNVVTVFVYAALGVYFFLLVLQLQVVSGWSPLAAGTSILPVTACMLLLSGRAGALAQRVGPRPLMATGCLLAAAGFLLALRIGPDASYPSDVLPSVLLLGLGLAATVAPLTASVLAAAPAHLAGAASGINNATARSAGLLAIAVVPAVAGLGRAGSDDPGVLAHGFAVAMLVSAGLLVVGALVSWFGLGRAGGRTRAAQDPVGAPH